MREIVDSHHHLWRYSPAEYPWIKNAGAVLEADFLLPELQAVAANNSISGFVAVQARQTLDETEWLLYLAEQSKLIRGVVGWLPLQDARLLAKAIEDYADYGALKSIRHVVQDEPDDEFLLRPAFNAGINSLGETGWAYDILIYARHLECTIKFVDQHPEQQFVLDHIAKPTISSTGLDIRWQQGIVELAKRPNVACKFSGVATEVRDADWNVKTILPYWEIAWQAFGSQRMMYGSDWPVCLLRTEYSRWLTAIQELAAGLSEHEAEAFWQGNAKRIYRI